VKRVYLFSSNIRAELLPLEMLTSLNQGCR